MAQGRRGRGIPPRKRRRRTGGARSSGAGSGRAHRTIPSARASGSPRPSGRQSGRPPAGARAAKARPGGGRAAGRRRPAEEAGRPGGDRPSAGAGSSAKTGPSGAGKAEPAGRTVGRTGGTPTAPRTAGDSRPAPGHSRARTGAGSRGASGPRQAARGTARRTRTVTTQDGRPSRSGARRPSAFPSAARSGGRGRPTGSRLRRAALASSRRPRYWLRWLLIIGIVLALVAGMSYAMVAGGVWVRETIRDQDDAEAASQVRTVYPAPAACDAAHLDVSVDAPARVGAGTGMTIGVTLTNTGDDACLLDVGGAALGAVIVSGDRTVWSSTDCPADPVERTLLIDAGGSASASLTWNGASAAASCTGAAPSPPPSSAPPPEATTPAPRDTATAEDGASPSASPTPTPTPLDPNAAGAGTYRFRLRLDGVDLTGEQTFIVT